MEIALHRNTDWRRMIALSLLIVVTGIMLSPVTMAAFVGIGGYISEKLIGDNTNEALYLGDGTNESVALGTAPIVSTSSATSSSAGGIVSATLYGNLVSLNGMPSADTWFEWGYSVPLANTTAVNTVTVTGGQTATINPDAGKTVYYQFCSSTDGISKGSIGSFLAGGAHGVSYWMLNVLLPIILAVAILIFVLIMTGNPLYAFAGAVIGLMAFYIIQAMVQML
jgi:hypothetical protein